MEVFELLESVPTYSSEAEPHITRNAYNQAVTRFTKHLTRAFELFRTYWRTDNLRLLDMSLEELGKASGYMDTIMYGATEKAVDKAVKRATFMYDLAAAMMGGKNA